MALALGVMPSFSPKAKANRQQQRDTQDKAHNFVEIFAR